MRQDGARTVMYLSALGGVLAAVALWNLMTAVPPPVPAVRLVVDVGDFGAPDGALQKELLGRLARYPGLDARAGETAGTPADFVLDGRLESSGDGWQLEVRLVDHDEDRVVWSEATRVQGGVPEAARRITEGVAWSLKIRPSQS